ncbi:negative cofactor 2 transcription regulator complex subunit ncb2 [Actinomortierella wolfii]|nr:negative cofactor 2 transcription regulator complex subunit ncb2 [Actinomortierella wolfii]
MSDTERNGPDDELSLPKEFIHLLASEANEICEKEAKKTIAAEHVIAALKDRKSGRLEHSGKTQEELFEEQARLFAAARERHQSQQHS